MSFDFNIWFAIHFRVYVTLGKGRWILKVKSPYARFQSLITKMICYDHTYKTKSSNSRIRIIMYNFAGSALKTSGKKQHEYRCWKQNLNDSKVKAERGGSWQYVLSSPPMDHVVPNYHPCPQYNFTSTLAGLRLMHLQCTCFVSSNFEPLYYRAIRGAIKSDCFLLEANLTSSSRKLLQVNGN